MDANPDNQPTETDIKVLAEQKRELELEIQMKQIELEKLIFLRKVGFRNSKREAMEMGTQRLWHCGDLSCCVCAYGEHDCCHHRHEVR